MSKRDNRKSDILLQDENPTLVVSISTIELSVLDFFSLLIYTYRFQLSFHLACSCALTGNFATQKHDHKKDDNPARWANKKGQKETSRMVAAASKENLHGLILGSQLRSTRLPVDKIGAEPC